jgi:hypothetical protein
MQQRKQPLVWVRKTSPMHHNWLNGGERCFDKKMSRYKTYSTDFQKKINIGHAVESKFIGLLKQLWKFRLRFLY